MPPQKIAIGSFGGVIWYLEQHTMEPAILFPVMKDVLDLSADDKTIVSIDGRVASIKDTWNVLAQQDAVGFRVRAPFRIRANVCCIQCRETFSASQSALTAI